MPSSSVSTEEVEVAPNPVEPSTSSNGDSRTPKKVFLSYARPLLNEAKKLQTHLAVQKRNGKIEFWYDQEIVVGDAWNEAIKAKIEKADIFILLLSADFWASDYIHEHELPLIEQRHEDGAKVMCVMVSANDFEETKWSRLQASPLLQGRLTPIQKWDNIDDAWQAVVDDLKKLI
jgi:TIR domain